MMTASKYPIDFGFANIYYCAYLRPDSNRDLHYRDTPSLSSEGFSYTAAGYTMHTHTSMQLFPKPEVCLVKCQVSIDGLLRGSWGML